MDASFNIRIRIPLIPGVNDSEESLDSIGEFCKDLNKLEHLQLLPYHRLGTSTYEKMGIEYQLKNVEVPSEEHMDWCRSIVSRHIKNVI